MKKQTSYLKIGLLDNSSHSLKRGYEMWSQWKQSEDPWLLKESVIWVHHGIELVLKQLLAETNEFLVFQDVNKAVERLGILRRKPEMENAGVLDLFEYDDKVMSVGFRNLVMRTAITLSISEFAENEPLRKKIDQLTRYRNSMVHFSIELDIVEVSGLLSEILEPLLSVLSRELKGESFKNMDVPGIRRLAQPVQTYVEGVRSEIVKNAICATEKSVLLGGTGRVGIVWQTTGTGLSQTLISYINHVRRLKSLEDNHILVVTDRIDIASQLYMRISQEEILTVALPKNKADLSHSLRSKKSSVIVSTVQKIDSDMHCSNDRIVLIGYNLYSSTGRLLPVFPNAICILFSSSPPLPNEDASNTFGPLIAKYDFQQAMEDGVVKPARLERRDFECSLNSGIKSQENNLPELSIDLKKSRHYLVGLAKNIIQHFELRQKEWIGKGVVIVADISTAIALSEDICRVKPEWRGDSVLTSSVKSISSNNSFADRKVLIDRFNNPDDPLQLIIATGSFLVGYDNPLVHTCYVTCPISRQLQYRLTNLVSKDSQDGLIVDYSELDWHLE